MRGTCVGGPRRMGWWDSCANPDWASLGRRGESSTLAMPQLLTLASMRSSPVPALRFGPTVPKYRPFRRQTTGTQLRRSLQLNVDALGAEQHTRMLRAPLTESLHAKEVAVRILT